MLQKAGIDTKRYKGHSTRGATALAARILGVPLNSIMKQTGWKNLNSFAMYYKKIEKHTSIARVLRHLDWSSLYNQSVLFRHFDGIKIYDDGYTCFGFYLLKCMS